MTTGNSSEHRVPTSADVGVFLGDVLAAADMAGRDPRQMLDQLVPRDDRFAQRCYSALIDRVVSQTASPEEVQAVGYVERLKYDAAAPYDVRREAGSVALNG